MTSLWVLLMMMLQLTASASAQDSPARAFLPSGFKVN
jgi:hypothetical protein